MTIFKITVYILAVICLITGANDFIGGVNALRILGANLTETGFSDPITDNVIRFFAGIWIGVGILFVIFLRDLIRYQPVMLVLFGIVLLGGIGRIISIVQYGMPENSAGAGLIIIGLIVEIGLMPFLAWWLTYRFNKAS